MDREEFINIAMAIKTAYPNAKVLQDAKAMDVWYLMLQDLDYSIAQSAIQEHITTNKFPPSIAEIREKCSTYTSIPIKDWGDAWKDVSDAIRFQGYMREKEALESLDEITRKCVTRLGYQNLCHSENETADRANFRIIYESLQKEKAYENQIPQQLKIKKQQMLDKLVNDTTKKIGGK